ncbi:hypothetical protein HRbin17_02254 [bacterium HR17]|uniref:Uncharacterized protein n=1 Tax=Candidatus Fervidibacter japonicus TaxID=2035412 RepID=A0A2H5XEW0_9BACT|nr:hypothetical protein HRbin17_02254 [bacterium HR17]
MRKMGLGVAVTAVFLATLGSGQRVLESQLAGVRLGSAVIDYDATGRLRRDCLLAIWGMPDYLAGPPTTPQQPGVPGAPSGPMPGMPGPYGAPPLGAPGMGSAFGGQPTLPGVMAGVGVMGQLAGTPMARPGIPGMMPGAPGYGGVPYGGLPGGEATVPGAPGMPGAMGMPGAAGVTGAPPRLWELAWVFPPFVQLDTNEIYFVYRRGTANLCFLVEARGERMEVVAISVAGQRFDAARTALGDPFKSVKLGDDLRRVFLRYGQPDELVYYNPVNLQLVPTATGNMILRYHKSSNIEFTVLNDRVVRIFIFLPGRVTFAR